VERAPDGGLAAFCALLCFFVLYCAWMAGEVNRTIKANFD